jgi:hypothetical protein
MKSVITNSFFSRFIFRRVTVILLPLLTFLIYLPSLFRYEVVKCVLFADGSITYYKRDNTDFLESLFYSVSAATQAKAERLFCSSFSFSASRLRVLLPKNFFISFHSV